MSELSSWLSANLDTLISTAASRLAQRESLQSEVTESVEAFFDGLARTILTQSPTPLNTILIDWVESSSAPSDVEMTSFAPVLTVLKQVTWEQLLQSLPSEEAVHLLLALDQVFTDAFVYLSRLEGDALIARMRDQLQQAEKRIEHLDRSKSNFIAVAAHELRTPLTLVEGYASMIASTEWARVDAQAPMLLQGIDSGTRRLKEIINDLIDVSLLDLKLMEFHLQPVWLYQIIQAAERNVVKSAGARQIQLEVENQSIPTIPIVGDPDRLLQAFQKIIMNAVKYTPDGGKVTIRARELPGFADVMVIDNGIGIDPSNLPLIFDTFSALGNSALHSSGKTKFKGGGPGLGLPIAKGIIEAHGGTIWAESDGYDEEKCPGSTFHIMIPLRPIQPDGKAPG